MRTHESLIAYAKRGDENPMSLVQIAKRHNVSLQDAKKMTPCFGRTGDKHPMFGKHHKFETLEKISKNQKITFSNTSCGEIDLRNTLIEMFPDISITGNVGISKYNCDIQLKNESIIIEYFGDNWHMNPALYKANDLHFRTNIPAAQIWEKDKEKLEFLRKLGYDVIIVWASDWKKKKQHVLQEIKDVISSKKKND